MSTHSPALSIINYGVGAVLATSMLFAGCGKPRSTSTALSTPIEVEERSVDSPPDAIKEETIESFVADKDEPSEVDSPEIDNTDDSESRNSPDPLTEPAVETELAAPTNQCPDLDPAPYRTFIPTEAGALIVDLDIRLDDVPLATAFQKRIEKIMDDAGRDKNSRVQWNDLLDHLESDPEQFGRNVANDTSQRRNLVQQYDRNRNNTADYEEIVKLLFRSSGFSTPFRLQGTDYFRGRGRDSKIFKCIDHDDNGSLSTNEIKQAAMSICRLDSNSDYRIDPAEIFGTPDENIPNRNNNDPAWNRRRSSRDANVATDLNGYIDWTMASYSLGDAGKTRPFSLINNPFQEIDRDQSGGISKNEAKTLLDVEPDLILRATLPTKRDDRPELQILWARTEMQPVVQSVHSQTRVALADEQLRLCATLSDNRAGRERIPIAVFAMLDANNDGGLDETEIPDQFEDQYPFEELDADEDGKLTRSEINEGMQPKSPIWSVQVRGRAAEFPDPLFAYLDQDNDMSLSTREINSAAQQIAICAQDGELSPNDIPSSFMIQIVRGDPTQQGQLFQFAPLSKEPANTNEVPRWARSMDSNGDGEISTVEFPGSQEQFAQLDSNHDGFIDFTEIQ